MSHVRNKRRRHELNSFHGEIRKLKPCTFDGENKNGEEDES